MRGNLAQVPQFTEMDAELEEAFLVDRQAVVTLSVTPVRIGETLDREIVGDEDGDAALVDPFEKAAVAPVEYGVAITEDIGVQACLPCR